MCPTTLTSHGRITIPKRLRDELGLQPGDVLELSVENGELRGRPIRRSVSDLFGMLHRPGARAKPLGSMNRAISDALATDDERIRRRG